MEGEEPEIKSKQASKKDRTISHFFSIADKKGNTRSIKIRADTKYEEIIGIKREWIHPLRDSISKCNLSPAYYDLAILELGKKCCKSGIPIDSELFSDIDSSTFCPLPISIRDHS